MSNKISAALSDADKAKALASIGEAKKLLSFLITLSNDTRKKSRRMGAKSVEYVNQNLQAAQSFGSVIPGSVDVAEFAKDVALVNQLIPLRVEIASLLERLDDSILAAGSDAMIMADIVYAYLKTAARNNGAVKAAITDIGMRFKGQGKKAATI